MIQYEVYTKHQRSLPPILSAYDTFQATWKGMVKLPISLTLPDSHPLDISYDSLCKWNGVCNVNLFHPSICMYISKSPFPQNSWHTEFISFFLPKSFYVSRT